MKQIGWIYKLTVVQTEYDIRLEGRNSKQVSGATKDDLKIPRSRAQAVSICGQKDRPRITTWCESSRRAEAGPGWSRAGKESAAALGAPGLPL
jgi:hypothetical protein